MNRTFILLLFAFLLILFPDRVAAQPPYFDVGGISMWQIPGELNADKSTETESYCFVSLPINVGKKSKIIVSPFYENRFLSTTNDDHKERLQSLTIPIAYLQTLKDTSWQILTFGAVRSNSTQFRFNGDVFQVAGAIMVNYRVLPTLTLKTGVYLSKEFYGDFFMYLVGIEWKINDRMNLFGLVNNNLRFEYKIRDGFYLGASFKAINTSYRYKGEGGYYKINDNQLSLYADLNLSKKFVWSVEAGHTIFRYIKARDGAPYPSILHDGPIFKTGVYYRVRL